MSTEPKDHGPSEVCYSGGDGWPYYQPHIVCLCGWAVREPSWEEAGGAFDRHLEETEDDAPESLQ